MKRFFVLALALLLAVALPLRGVLAHALSASVSVSAAAQVATMAQAGAEVPCHEAVADQDEPAPGQYKDCLAKCALCAATCTAAALPSQEVMPLALAVPHGLYVTAAAAFHSAMLALPFEPPISRL